MDIAAIQTHVLKRFWELGVRVGGKQKTAPKSVFLFLYHKVDPYENQDGA